MSYVNIPYRTVVIRLSGSGLRGQQPQQRNPDSPLPSHFHQLDSSHQIELFQSQAHFSNL